jgi:hypothetical protein
MELVYHEPALDQEVLDTIFESGRESIAPNTPRSSAPEPKQKDPVQSISHERQRWLEAELGIVGANELKSRDIRYSITSHF